MLPPDPRPPSRGFPLDLTPPRLGLHLLVLFVGYLLLALGAAWLSRQPGTISTLWYANAFGIAFLWNQSPRRWPALLGVMAGANVLAGSLIGDTPQMSACFVPANLLEMSLAAWLLRRTGVAVYMDRSPLAFLRFILLGVLVPPLFSAPLAAGLLQWADYGSFWRTALSWFEGAVLGTVSILPLMVQVQLHGLRSLDIRRRPREFGLYSLAVLVMTPVTLLYVPFPFVYLSLPLLLAAARLSFGGTALLVGCMSLLGGLVIAAGELDTPRIDGMVRELAIYLPLLLSLLPPLLLAAAVEQGRRRRRDLAASEARFRSAMDESAIGMALVDLDGRWQGINRALCEMLDYNRDDLLRLSFREISHPDDLPRDLALLDELLAGQRTSYRLEKRYLRRDGREVWALLAVSLVRDDEGRPQYFIAQIEDIDRRKRAEAREADLLRRYSLATESSGVGVWEWYLASDRIMWDDSLFRLYGLAPRPGAVSYGDWARYLHPADAPGVHCQLQQVRQGQEQADIEFRVIHPDGQVRVLRALGSLVRDASGEPERMVGTAWDVTELRQLAERLRDERERLQVTLNSIGDGVVTTDLQGRVNFLNPVAVRLSGWSNERALGQPIETVLPLEGEHGEVLENPVRQCLEQGTHASIPGLSSLRHPAGGLVAVRGQAAPIRSGQGELLGSVLVFTDVSEARAMQKHLRYAATHDALTALLNRSAFESALAESCHDAEQNDRHSVLCFIDLDRFKHVNDTAGHAAGDEMLRRIARLMQSLVRSGDVLARLGGDEFALILRNCPLDRAQLLGNRLIEGITQMPFEWEDQPFSVGASLGLSRIRPGNSDPEQLLRQADAACYQAKRSGRGCLAIHAGSSAGA
ncbi:PAS domain S-box protein [Pseudomonas otitidis]|uniref:PAS domain S-box protein n=1 Tax=Metapseudomonas otitidis TaxID=319939 RepID=UPI0024ACBB7D|nr:PAS domain S-box protein [Pseudomonas otitidis]MDI6529025.1 PAS domain S-box protein [Pseudomonas otitidis]